MHHFTAPTKQVIFFFIPPPTSYQRASAPTSRQLIGQRPPAVCYFLKPNSINSSLRARSKKPLIEKTGQCKKNTLVHIHKDISLPFYIYLYIYTALYLLKWYPVVDSFTPRFYFSTLFLTLLITKEGAGAGIKSRRCPPHPRLQKHPMHITIYTVCTTFAFFLFLKSREVLG